MKKKYDVTFSFAAKDRDVAKELARSLSNEGFHIFFDDFSSSELWGKELYAHLSNIFESARICIVLLSKSYTQSNWTLNEYKSLFAQSTNKDDFSILPIKIDNSELPSEFQTLNYIKLDKHSTERIASFIKDKLSSLPKPSEQFNEIYHVSSREEGWVVRRSGASRASSFHKTQSEAIDNAKHLAENKPNSEIIIHNVDGSIKNRIKMGEN